MKFHTDMLSAKAALEKIGHVVLMPDKATGIDYWSDDNKAKVAAKKGLELIEEHMKKIEKGDAILVINVTKKEIENYIGANTFLEMGYAYYLKKKIYTLNPLPDQKYILDELLAFSPVIINGNLDLIK